MAPFGLLLSDVGERVPHAQPLPLLGRDELLKLPEASTGPAPALSGARVQGGPCAREPLGPPVSQTPPFS